jgi:hypothetical protein
MQDLYTDFGQVKQSYVPTEFNFVRFVLDVICCGYLSLLTLSRIVTEGTNR